MNSADGGGLREMLPPRNATMIPLNWKFELDHFEFLILLLSTEKERGHLLTTVIAPDHQGEVMLLLQNGKTRDGTQIFFPVPPSTFISNTKNYWKTLTTKERHARQRIWSS